MKRERLRPYLQFDVKLDEKRRDEKEIEKERIREERRENKRESQTDRRKKEPVARSQYTISVTLALPIDIRMAALK